MSYSSDQLNKLLGYLLVCGAIAIVGWAAQYALTNKGDSLRYFQSPVYVGLFISCVVVYVTKILLVGFEEADFNTNSSLYLRQQLEKTIERAYGNNLMWRVNPWRREELQKQCERHIEAHGSFQSKRRRDLLHFELQEKDVVLKMICGTLIVYLGMAFGVGAPKELQGADIRLLADMAIIIGGSWVVITFTAIVFAYFLMRLK